MQYIDNNRLQRYSVRRFPLLVLGFLMVAEALAFGQTPDHCHTEEVLQTFLQHRKLGQPTLQAPIMQTSIVSPSGHFKILFDTTGIHAATMDYVNTVAKNADEAELLEVDTLGYEKPPYSFADSMWYIFLRHQGGSNYGFTSAVDAPFAISPTQLQRYRSYITIDNAFSDSSYITKGVDAARVTIFHEFHHVIQFANFGVLYTPEHDHDVNFREMTSVWLEMRSSPTIKDYMQYVSIYLENLGEQFDKMVGSGYPQCIWWQFLTTRYSDNIVQDVWKWYSDNSSDYLLAMDSVLARNNSGFCNEYKIFGAGLLEMKDRWHPSIQFPIDPPSLNHLSLTTLADGETVNLQMKPASLQLFQTHTAAGTTENLILSRGADRSFISDTKVSYDGGFLYQASELQTYCDSTNVRADIVVDAFPQPFVIGATDVASILASRTSTPPVNVDMSILTAANVLVRHIETSSPLREGRGWFVQWDGKDDIGKTVQSGIYVYTVLTDGIRSVGKIAVVNNQH